MKKRKKLVPHSWSKQTLSREPRESLWKTHRREIIAAFFLCVAIITATLLYVNRRTRDEADRLAWEATIEGELITTAMTNRVHPDYRPALVYRYRGEEKRPAYTGVGTLVNAASGPLFVTCEHLLMKKFTNELLVLRYLSPDEHQVTSGIRSIAYKNVDLGIPSNVDVVFLRPGDPQRVECFSERSEDTPITGKAHFFKDVQIGGRVIRSVRSLVSGHEFEVIGVMTDPLTIIISKKSRSGDSGTGFVDEFGQLYVLSGSPHSSTNISMLAGPYALDELKRR